MRRELDRDFSGILYSVPEARARHRRAVLLRVFLPLAAALLAIAGLMAVAGAGAGGNLSRLAAVALVYLAIGGAVAGWLLFVAAFLFSRATGEAVRALPRWSGRARATVALLSFRVRTLADQAVGVVHVGIRLGREAEQAVSQVIDTVRGLLRRIITRGGNG